MNEEERKTLIRKIVGNSGDVGDSIIIAYNQGQQDREKEIKDKIHLASQCLQFKSVSCDNADCKNIYCPLNKQTSGFGSGDDSDGRQV